MIDDFVRRLKDDLSKKQVQLTDNLVAAAATDHDKIAGKIIAYKSVIGTIDTIARDFLVGERTSR